ncbi:MAG: hypothetical protein IJM18_11175 [Clostridia bacterium]|nr:hypothetical protein [Clostridia bacterium]
MSRVSITANPGVIALIRRHLSDECRALKLSPSSFTLIENNGVDTEQFSIRWTSD